MGTKKAQARSQALLWWKSSRDSASTCDKCNVSLKLRTGFLCKPLSAGAADLLCEACFDTTPRAGAFEGAVPVDRSDPNSKVFHPTPWNFIIFLIAFVATLLAWGWAVYRAVIDWQGTMSIVHLVFGTVLLVLAVLLAFDLGRRRMTAITKGFIYAPTLLVYFIFVLFMTGASVWMWIGMVPFWGLAVLLMLNYITDYVSYEG